MPYNNVVRFIEPGTTRPDAPNRQCDRLDEFPQSAPASANHELHEFSDAKLCSGVDCRDRSSLSQ